MTAQHAPRFSNLPTWVVLAGGLASTLVVGALDWVTGPDLGFSLFYVLPVALVTWWASARHGWAMALVCGAVWSFVEVKAGPAYRHPSYAAWNGLIRLGFFAISVVAVRRWRAVLEHEQALSRIDRLTGLANSRAFYAAMDRELERSRRHGTPLTLCYIDLDNFKQVNDNLGHPAGDALLKRIGVALVSAIRRVDLAARLGGDEFCVLLPDTDEPGARTVIGRMHRELLATTRRADCGVTFSLGVVSLHAGGQTPETIVAYADRLMYEVKRSGKNGVRYAVMAASGDEDGGAASADVARHEAAPRQSAGGDPTATNGLGPTSLGSPAGAPPSRFGHAHPRTLVKVGPHAPHRGEMPLAPEGPARVYSRGLAGMRLDGAASRPPRAKETP